MPRFYLIVELPSDADPAPSELQETLTTALAQAGYGEQSEVSLFASCIALAHDDPEQAELREEHAGFIQDARRLYEDDDLQIDDYPNVAPAEDNSGAWISAWVWVASEHEQEG